jgi:transposase
LIYCGIDWAERTHDVALADDSGQLLAKRHITDDAAGYTILLDLLAEHGDTEQDPIPVAIETSRGLLVPRPALRLTQKVRSRRRPGTREHPPHRHARPPATA